MSDTDTVEDELKQLAAAAKYLRDNWGGLSPGERDQAWWKVHKASRAVWNRIHPKVIQSKEVLTVEDKP